MTSPTSTVPTAVRKVPLSLGRGHLPCIAGPRWASWNLGVFLCIRCAGIHRKLGTHISRVKSVNLDKWTDEQILVLRLPRH